MTDILALQELEQGDVMTAADNSTCSVMLCCCCSSNSVGICVS